MQISLLSVSELAQFTSSLIKVKFASGLTRLKVAFVFFFFNQETQEDHAHFLHLSSSPTTFLATFFRLRAFFRTDSSAARQELDTDLGVVYQKGIF